MLACPPTTIVFQKKNLSGSQRQFRHLIQIDAHEPLDRCWVVLKFGQSGIHCLYQRLKGREIALMGLVGQFDCSRLARWDADYGDP